jgi:hypothetical protein
MRLGRPDLPMPVLFVLYFVMLIEFGMVLGRWWYGP